MQLESVTISNFRNLTILELPLSKGLNVILGENNVGKTNVLDAIRAALGASSATTEPLRLTKEDLHRRPDGTYSTDPIRIDLVFGDLSEQDQAECLDILAYDAVDPAKSKASIHFEWSYDETADRWHTRRWGGGRGDSDSSVPDDVLQGIPVTLLGALRDAVVALSPSRSSRLGRLFRTTATKEQQAALEKILADTNAELEKNDLVVEAEKKIAQGLKAASGPHLGQDAAIRATEPSFERIVNNLRLVLRDRVGNEASAVYSELRSNGLGFNNLLYIATVLAELDAAKKAALPLLLVEEPEAHLHPQLQTLLADYLERGGVTGDHGSKIQTIVTTHSPTIAAHVRPESLRVLHRTAKGPRVASLAACGLEATESKKLRRMLDVTRATMLFARGVILVEGISEALLLPVLARRLARSLEDTGIAIVPMAGVDFSTFAKLFAKGRLEMPVAVVTDGDPKVLYAKDRDVKTARPQAEGDGAFVTCDRVATLRSEFADNVVVRICVSSLTLEYDLAAESIENASCVRRAWESCYQKGPKSLDTEAWDASPNEKSRALLLWRSICLGKPLHGKAEVAQALSELLDARDASNKFVENTFAVPKYLREAFDHVLPRVEK